MTKTPDRVETRRHFQTTHLSEELKSGSWVGNAVLFAPAVDVGLNPSIKRSVRIEVPKASPQDTIFFFENLFFSGPKKVNKPESPWIAL